MTTIKPETFDFLSKLQQNNNREWFNDQKAFYLAAKENVELFAEELINSFRNVCPVISAELSGKKAVKRIYRDVRFSKNKAPYKSNFGISIPTTPKGIHGPGYFIQIQPNHSFVAGGMWLPEAAHLKLIRQEIDYNGSHLIEILENPTFKSFFGEGMQQNDKLKTTPKNYEADHPHIDLLKLKSFTVHSALTDKQFQSLEAVDQITTILEHIVPFNAFLQEAIAVN